MTALTALLLAVAASFGWSGLDLVRKFLAHRMSALALVAGITLVALPGFGLWVAAAGAWGWSPGYLLPAATSVVLNLAANVAYFRSLQLSPLSATVPLLSLTPAFTALLAVPALGETLSAGRALGVALVVAGAFALNLRGGDGDSVAKIVRAFARERGSVLMALVALLWSATLPLDKIAVARSSVPLHAFVLNAGVAFGVILVLAVRGRLAQLSGLSRAPFLLLAAVACGSFALASQLAAMQELAVAIIETLKRGVGGAMAVVWGGLFFAEQVTRPRVIAILLMTAGVGLIVF